MRGRIAISTSWTVPTQQQCVRCPPAQAVLPTKRGTRIGVPLGVGVWLPVRDVDLRLDVNDPRVVADVGRDVDRRGHADRRVDGRGGLGGGGEAEDGGGEPASDDGGKSELGHCGAFFFLSSVVFEPWRECRGSDAVSAGDDASFVPI